MYILAAHVEDTGMPLRDAIGVTILAFDINRAIDVNRRRINAPLEAIWMVGDAVERSVGLGYTAVRFRAVELPFRNEIFVKLRDIERACRNARGGANDVADPSAGVAVEPSLFVVVVVFNHNGVSAVVCQNGRRSVPAKVKESQDRTRYTVELDQMTASDVVASVGAVEHISIRQDSR